MQEIWKDIPDYEGIYQASNLGRVKSLERLVNSGLRNNKVVTRKEKILSFSIDTDGYFKVALSKDNVRKTFSVHRLIAKTFLNNPNEYPCINHKDENKQNNNVSNLEYCSVRYNNLYNNLHLRKANLRKKAILQIKDGNVLKEWSSPTNASKELKISRGNIVSCCSGQRKTAGGYKWEYVD